VLAVGARWPVSCGPGCPVRPSRWRVWDLTASEFGDIEHLDNHEPALLYYSLSSFRTTAIPSQELPKFRGCICGMSNHASKPQPAPLGSREHLERILHEQRLPDWVPDDLMSRRGYHAERLWAAVMALPVYEPMTVWVMAAWPERNVDRVDKMVRTAIAGVRHVQKGEWSTARLEAVIARAGRRPEHDPVHRHRGQEIQHLSHEQLDVEPTDESLTPRLPVDSSLGPAVVRHLRLALGEHAYLVTPPAAELLDAAVDVTVDHLNRVRAKGITAEQPDGIVGLALLASARPSAQAAKSNRITDVFRDLPHLTSVSLAHLLLGTDQRPDASLLWRCLHGLPATNVPPEVVASWRAELPALTPEVLTFSERRRRRVRDRCRRGEDLQRTFEMAAGVEVSRLSLPHAV
jgi:hypothetical protein